MVRRTPTPAGPATAVEPEGETEHVRTKTVPIPPDQVRDNVEGELAENGEVIRHTTVEVEDVNPEAGTSEGNPPVEDPNILRNTSDGADENAPELEPVVDNDDPETERLRRVPQSRDPDGFGPLGSPERARNVREDRARRPAEEGYGRAPDGLRPEDAQGGETTEELQTKANRPIENSGKPSNITIPGRKEQLQVGQQVDLATANRMSQRATKEMNESFDKRLTLDEMRQQRRRGRSVV